MLIRSVCYCHFSGFFSCSFALRTLYILHTLWRRIMGWFKTTVLWGATSYSFAHGYKHFGESTTFIFRVEISSEALLSTKLLDVTCQKSVILVLNRHENFRFNTGWSEIKNWEGGNCIRFQCTVSTNKQSLSRPRISLPFMELEDSLMWSEEPSTGPYPETKIPIHNLTQFFSKINFIIILPFPLWGFRLKKVSSFSVFLWNFAYISNRFHKHSVHLINLVTLIIYSKKYTLWISSLRSYLHPPVIC
jgi:hypothetical protein